MYKYNSNIHLLTLLLLEQSFLTIVGFYFDLPVW